MHRLHDYKATNRRPAVRGSCRSSLRGVRTAGARPRRPSQTAGHRLLSPIRHAPPPARPSRAWLPAGKQFRGQQQWWRPTQWDENSARGDGVAGQQPEDAEPPSKDGTDGLQLHGRRGSNVIAFVLQVSNSNGPVSGFNYRSVRTKG
ncbi:hypothetical protein SEVIR_6G033495v4 [Setaria viridis]